MTLEQLRIFVAVAEREHLTAAARALNLTQSAVSGAIAALEARHQVRLFDRVGRGIVCNAVGRAFLEEARGVLARVSLAEGVLADLSALRRGRLTIAASQTIVGYWLPRHLAAFRAAHPGIELAVAVGNTREVARAVCDGTAELGFVEGAVDEASLSMVTVAQDRLVVVVAPDHPWVAREMLTMPDLAGAAWVLREPGSGTRSSFETALRALGVDPAGLRVPLTLPSNESVLAACEAGAGATALSDSVTAASLAAGRLVRAPLRLPQRAFSLLRHKERYRSKAGDALVALLG